ncbi:NAD-dependent epimerase/dehydratase family protein [Psychrobacter sp. LV10R520-6]|uniref:NAD-dependent epimerase/dehydratase family protein n=1 Tax=Psychrobacter sp. LV10R520-6 TaxID=1415574 RepID=UPI0024C61ACB|nr:NAD-dependent epimerase/dehydratase family protein [Psychrobacter sp. LV10R520-6]SNT69454.1 NAD dependent epimerase/dehydratase family protein [Psychrobacter sp. LV10R520-6]
MQRKAIVIGATGLVGQHLIKQLSELYDTLIVIARRPPRYINTSMRFYQVNDFDNLAEVFASVGADRTADAFSCLGTTKKQAGSDETFRKVDHIYNLTFAKLCRDKGVENFFLLSSMNADSDSRFLYNRVKAETEQSIMALGFAQLVIFRPSLLLGKHKGRPLESISQKAFQLISPLISESLPLHPISAKRVASAMAMTAHDIYERSKYRSESAPYSTDIIENKQMLAITRVKH